MLPDSSSALLLIFQTHGANRPGRAHLLVLISPRPLLKKGWRKRLLKASYCRVYIPEEQLNKYAPCRPFIKRPPDLVKGFENSEKSGIMNQMNVTLAITFQKTMLKLRF